MIDPPPPYTSNYTSRPPSYTERTPLLNLPLPTQPRLYHPPSPRAEDISTTRMRMGITTCISISIMLLVAGLYFVLLGVVFVVFVGILGPG